VQLFTIGFTQKPAEDFFGKLKRSGARRVLDVRLNNVSQLSGFAKRKDLEFFLRELCQMDYVHMPELAPTQDMLDEYKKNKGAWSIYEAKFLDLMRRGEIERRVDPELVRDGCLLCSEDKAHHCHRRLVAEYLQQHWGNIELRHL
jgi:uncharacterized protein (DUF488 family)